MSIITKKKTTETFLASLDTLPKNTQDNFTRYPVIRTCWLAQASSGMRIGEVLAVRKRDLVFKERIQVYIKATGSKNHRGRTVFLSKETQEAIEVYLDDLKDDDLVFYKGVTGSEKSREINALRNLRVCLNRLGLGMRYDSGKYKISSHSLRAFFFTKAVRKPTVTDYNVIQCNT